MTVFVGIDPGIQGAIGCIFPLASEVIDMPKFISKDLFAYLKKIKKSHSVFCVLEAAQPMPNQGIVGAFTYGTGYGKIKAVLEILQIPFVEITPMKWKKEFSLVKKDKAASIKYAQQLFPSISFQTERGRWLDGRAEALLLAEYGKRMHSRGTK